MIVTPHILREIQGQALPTDAALGRESSLEVAPEPFQSVDVGPGSVGRRDEQPRQRAIAEANSANGRSNVAKLMTYGAGS